MPISKRTDGMKPFLAMELLEAVEAARAEGKDVISLALGEPDFDAPAVVKEAIVNAIAKNLTKYTHSQGLLELREEIVSHYKARYGVTVSPEQVVVTSGTSPAMLLVFGALLDAGDELILPDPHYACYPSFLKFLNAQPRYVRVHEEAAFQYRPEDVAKQITKQTKGILITSPANPTGTLMPAETMQAMADLGPYIVSDEIYHGLEYEPISAGGAGLKPAPTVLQFTDRAFVLNGFSKAYAMTGFRLGYIIAPPEFVRSLQILQQNLFISANSFVQMAGIVALRDAGPDVERMREEFDRRRRILLAGLRELGFGIAVEPLGAFYIFANAKHLTNDSYAFVMDLFKATGVAVTPGIDFGPGGEGYLRFSYANSLENIEEALRRIGGHLK